VACNTLLLVGFSDQLKTAASLPQTDEVKKDQQLPAVGTVGSCLEIGVTC